MDKGLDELRACLARYSRRSICSLLAGLQFLPGNSHFANRLAIASRVAARWRSTSDLEAEPEEICRELNEVLGHQCFQSIEDPPEDSHTRVIHCAGSDYLICSAFAPEVSTTLEGMLIALKELGECSDNSIAKESLDSVRALLTLSDTLATNAALGRWEFSLDLDPITCSDAHRSSKQVARMASIKSDNLAEMLEEQGLGIQNLIPFIMDLYSDQLLNSDPMENALFQRPILRIGDVYILSIPTAVVHASINHVLLHAAEHKFLDLLIEGTTAVLWKKSRDELETLGYRMLPDPPPPLPNRLGRKDCVMSFDTDKAAYALLVVDDANGIERGGIFSHSQTDLSVEVASRIEQIREFLNVGRRNGPTSMLAIILVQGVGRPITIGYRNGSDSAKQVLLSLEELTVLNALREYDMLTLWKYTSAWEKLSSEHITIALSFLDRFAEYRSRHHSFYLSDESPPHMVVIRPHSSTPMRVEALGLSDPHSALFTERDSVRVTRLYRSKTIPIYSPPKYQVNHVPCILLESYRYPIWLQVSDLHKNAPPDVKSHMFSLLEVVAYWLWRFHSQLHNDIDYADFSRLHIAFEFEQATPESTSGLSNHRSTEPLASIDIKVPVLRVYLPKGMWPPSVDQYTNAAELRVMMAVLEGFQKIITTTDRDREEEFSRKVTEAMEKAEENPMMRRIVTFEAKGAYERYHRVAGQFRLLQKHDLEAESDNLARDLGIADRVGPVAEEERNEICKAAAQHYLEKLRECMEPLDRSTLVRRLVELNEACCAERTRRRHLIPHWQLCFSDAEGLIHDDAEKQPLREITYLCYRALIEFVAAEPPSGSEYLSQTTMDRMLALMKHLITWAQTADFSYFDVGSFSLNVLASGRLGIAERDDLQAISRYAAVQQAELIEEALRYRATKSFSHLSESDLHIPTSELNEVFQGEFGFRYNTLRDVSIYLGAVKDESQAPYIEMRKEDLRSNLVEELSAPDVEISEVIDFLTLTERNKWDASPPGFEFYQDIAPWRNNRRLSYIRRPVIEFTSYDGDSLLIWGPMQIEVSIAFFLSRIMSGSLQPAEKQSDSMKRFVSKRLSISGADFQKQVESFFECESDWVIRATVQIGPDKELNAEDDLGDIDILIGVPGKNLIISAECKSIIPSLTAWEMKNEISSLLEEGGKVAKHMNRHEWLSRHIVEVSELLDMPLREAYIISVLILSRELSSTYVREFPLPVYSLHRLKKEGVQLLTKEA